MTHPTGQPRFPRRVANRARHRRPDSDNNITPTIGNAATSARCPTAAQPPRSHSHGTTLSTTTAIPHATKKSPTSPADGHLEATPAPP